MHSRLVRRFVLALAFAARAEAQPPDTYPGATTPAAPAQTPAPPVTALAKPAVARPKSRPAVPQSPHELRVDVLDPAGKPVEGALVSAWPSVGAFVGIRMNQEKRRSGVTGKDGRAALTSMPGAPWELEVRARGFARSFQSRLAAATVIVRLARGEAIAGRVLDGTSRAPVAGARVRVDEWDSLPGEGDARPVASEAVTDARGAFRLEGLGRSAVTLVARAAGYAPARRDSARPGAPVELFLFPGPGLTGTVRDDAGRPVAGASIRLFAEGWGSVPPVDATDDSGRFTAAGVEPGGYWLAARAGARAPTLARVAVDARDEASAELIVADGGSVTGRIVDAAGRPVARATVRPDAFEGQGLPALLSDALAATASGDGVFTVGPLPPGAFGLEVGSRGRAPTRVSAVVVPRKATDLGDVALDEGLLVRGRVRDRAGAGLGGVQVSAESRRQEGFAVETQTDADGGFSLVGLSAGAYDLTASAAGFARAEATANAGGEPVELVLEEAGTLTGRVVDASGRPAEDARVEAESAGASPRETRSMGAPANEGDGRFTFRDVGAGIYVVRARAPGLGEGSLTGVRVVAGRATDAGTIALAASGRVTGVVVDADGQPIPGATVRVERDPNSYRSDDPSAQTDSTGTFEARGVRPGRMDVVASHPAYVSARQGGVEVDLEKEPPAVRIVLGRGARIEGRARHRDGRPFDGRVAAWSASGGAGPGGEPVPTQADGSFVVEHVPPGRVSVVLLTRVSSHPSIGGPSGMTILAGATTREIEAREGEAASVDLVTRDIVVFGRVTRAGQGLAGITVTAIGPDGQNAVTGAMGTGAGPVVAESGPPAVTATTREDGSFDLVTFGPGRTYVQMRSAERQSLPAREVEIPDVERYEMELEVGGAAVAGVVVDRDSGASIADAIVAVREPGPSGSPKGGGSTGPDGRFSFDVSPGDYVLEASAPRHRPSKQALAVSDAGAVGLRLELEAGLEIAGRVVSAVGAPVPDVLVFAVEADGTLRWPTSGRALPDGTFRLTGLGSEAYAVVAGSASEGFAIRPGVTPGDGTVTLTLRPGGRLRVRLVSADGAPVVEGAYVSITGWNGTRLRSLPLGSRRSGDAPGTSEMTVPAGTLEVSALWEARSLGSASVQVAPGETKTIDVVVTPR